MFNSTNFISTYNSTDKAIRLLNDQGRIVHTLSVCNYQKSGVFGRNLTIVLEDNLKEYSLEFASNNDAKLALTLLKDAINTLRVNCKPASGGGSGPSVTPIAITYAQYKTLQSSNTLEPLQWYDVTDATNQLFPAGPVIIRLLAKTSNDRHPRGQVLSNHIYVGIDAVDDRIVYYEDTINKNTLLNSDISTSLFANSTNIMAINDSVVNASDSNFIIAENNSSIVCSSSQRVKATNGCNIQMNNGFNVNIDNIQQDLTVLPFNLQDVDVDRHLSRGKTGRTTLLNPGGTTTLYAYKDTVEYEITMNVNNSTVTYKLDNLITQSNAQFRFKIKGTGTNVTVSIRDKNNAVLMNIQENLLDKFVVFAYNKSSQKFELLNVENVIQAKGKVFLFTSITNGQTNFTFNYPVSTPSDMEMYVNGQKQIYGLDFSYNAGLGQAVYAERQFSLAVNDEVEFKVY